MGRPQKPFTVEVRRGRKGVSSPAPAGAPKSAKAKAPSEPVAAEREVAAPPPRPAPRRILDVIEPPVEAVQIIPPAAGKPRRGRPPKTAIPGVAPRKPGRPRRQPAPELKLFADRPGEPSKAFVAASPAPLAAKPPTLAPSTLGSSTHGHLSHGARAEAATGLPRGERWKRRVPKVLW